MFGYVPRAELDEARSELEYEREARIRAEANADLWRDQVTHLNQTNLRLTETISKMSGSYERQHEKTLLHVAPLAPERPDEGENQLRPQTPEEILAEPATTKREMRVRALRAAIAREKEQEARERKAQEDRQKILSEDEKRSMADTPFDNVLGVYDDQKPEAVNDAS